MNFNNARLQDNDTIVINDNFKTNEINTNSINDINLSELFKSAFLKGENQIINGVDTIF